MKEKIQEELKRIELEENVRILLAVESGSRAWGFASLDSDYDVRFIYIRNEDFYLRLDDTRDVIEYPINDLLDINGWDLSKTLKLAYSCNPTLLEWIQSPIIYKEENNVEELRKIIIKYYSKKKSLHHYYHIAEGHYNAYLKDKEQIKLKKYFYILRSLLAAKYVLHHDSIPPMEFKKLVKEELPSNLNIIVEDLLDKKIHNPEIKMIQNIPELDSFIHTSLEDIQNEIITLNDNKKDDWQDINHFFIRTIKK